MPAKALQYYRLTRPVLPPSIGQGAPEGITIGVDGRTVTLLYNAVYRASATSDAVPGIGNPGADIPLLRSEIIDQIGIAGEVPGGLFVHLTTD